MQHTAPPSALHRARQLRERLPALGAADVASWLEDAKPWPTKLVRLSDDNPEADLLEDMLLAHVALGETPTALPAEVQALVTGVGSPAPGEDLRLGHRIVEGAETPVVEPAVAAALARGERIEARWVRWDNPTERLLNVNNSTLNDIAFSLLQSPFRLLARHPEALPAILADSQAQARLRWLQPPTSFVHHASSSEEALVRDAVSAPLHTDRVGATWQLHLVSNAPPPGRRFDRGAEAEARIAERIAAISAPADESTRLEVAALTAGLLAAPTKEPVDLALVYGAGHAIARALLRSPFFGSDPQILGARLSATVHEAMARLTPDGSRPPLPFGTGAQDLRPEWPALRELLLVGLPRLTPLIRGALTQLAGRAARSGEEALIENSHRYRGLSGPHAPEEAPLDPPMFARYLLQRHNQPWLPGASAMVKAELVTALELRPPEHMAWLMTALFQGSSEWDDATQARLVSRHAALNGRLDDHPVWYEAWCLWGVALLPALPGPDAIVLVERAVAAADTHRVGLLKLIAERTKEPEVRAAAARALLELLRGEARAMRPPAGTALLLLLKQGVLDSSWRAEVGGALTADLRRHPSIHDLVQYADERR